MILKIEYTIPKQTVIPFGDIIISTQVSMPAVRSVKTDFREKIDPWK